jgi:uncharacterized membrane protein
MLEELALMLAPKELDKLEVAAFSSASVANVASKDELKDSKSVTLVLNEPLSTTKADMLEELALMLAPKELDKLEVAAFNSASVANVASKDELKDSKSVTLVLNEPLSTCRFDMLAELALILKPKELDKLEVAAFSSASVAKVASKDELKDSKSVTLVLNEPLSTCKADMLAELALISTAKELDKLAVAAFSSASVANVESRDELKDSKSVTRVENEPLSTCKADMLEEFALISTAKELDKLAVAAFSSASVAKVASKDELKDSKSVTLVLNEPLSTTKLAMLAELALMFSPKELDKLEVAAFSSASVANVASKDELKDSRPVNRVAKEAEPSTLDSST